MNKKVCIYCERRFAQPNDNLCIECRVQTNRYRFKQELKKMLKFFVVGVLYSLIWIIILYIFVDCVGFKAWIVAVTGTIPLGIIRFCIEKNKVFGVKEWVVCIQTNGALNALTRRSVTNMFWGDLRKLQIIQKNRSKIKNEQDEN